MDSANLSRRSLLQAIAAAIATAATPIGWAEIAQAMDETPAAAQTGGAARRSCLFRALSRPA